MDKIKPLSRLILDCLIQGEVVAGFEESLLSPNKLEVRRKTETHLWDYKEDIDLDNNYDIAKLAKRIIGFHNHNGGVLIFGVNDKTFKTTGIQDYKIIDNVQIYNKIKKYVSARNIIFQDRIALKDKSNRSIWLIFINKREGKPICTLCNGPERNKKLLFQKGDYFIRIDDEIKSCKDPIDYELLYSGVSFTHLKAYSYEVDESQYRLLAPHTSEFIGREKIIEKVFELLKSRFFLFSLDGAGGIGKTAIAIEIVKRLYNSCEYDFIVSLSAKNKVWSKFIGSRQSDFSGLSGLVNEIANVLDIETNKKSTDQIKEELIEFFGTFKGLLLIDNIEDIKDEEVFEFIKMIPDPTKTIVTSRVDKNLGAMRIDIPRMTDSEARILLKKELELRGYKNYEEETEHIESIIEISNYLPLAIKWAASLIHQKENLKEVSETIRKMGAERKEFLEYIFSTMYDALSVEAKEIACLSTYLGLENWTDISCSILLDLEESIVKKSIAELEDKDILIRPENETGNGVRNMLPITSQFLSNKWHQNRNLRVRVEEKIEALVPIPDKEGNIFTWPIEERIKHIFEYTSELELEEKYKEADKLIKLAYQWDMDDSLNSLTMIKLKFREGKIKYLKGQERELGILQMSKALEGYDEELELYYEWLFLGFAMLKHGRQSDEKIVWQILSNNLSLLKEVPLYVTVSIYEKLFIKRQFEILRRLLVIIKDPDLAYQIYHNLDSRFKNNNNRNSLGKEVSKFFTIASQTKHSLSQKELTNIINLGKTYEQVTSIISPKTN